MVTEQHKLEVQLGQGKLATNVMAQIVNKKKENGNENWEMGKHTKN